MPEMICHAALAEKNAIDGVTVRVVVDEASLDDFIAVNAEAYATYGMPPEVLTDLFDEVAAVLQNYATSIVVARRDDHAIATAMVYASDGVASLQWVGTVPAARARRASTTSSVHGGADQPGLRRRSIVVLAPGVTHGRFGLHQAGLRDRLPLHGVRPLAGAAGELEQQRGFCPRVARRGLPQYPEKAPHVRRLAGVLQASSAMLMSRTPR